MYKITFKNHLKLLFQDVLTDILMVMLILYFSIFVENFPFYGYYGIVLLGLAYVCPGHYLHFKYWKKNKNNILILNTNSIILQNIKTKKCCSVEFTDSVNIYFVMSVVTFNNGNYHLFGSTLYNYIVISNNYNTLIITNLLYYDLEQLIAKFSNAKVSKIDKFIANI